MPKYNKVADSNIQLERLGRCQLSLLVNIVAVLLAMAALIFTCIRLTQQDADIAKLHSSINAWLKQSEIPLTNREKAQGNRFLTQRRSKRCLDGLCTEENNPDNTQAPPHSCVPLSDIAFYYGDRYSLEDKQGEFRPAHRYVDKRSWCTQFQNRWNNLWCRGVNTPDTFYTTRALKQFRYFTRGKWMKADQADRNYFYDTSKDNSGVIVKSHGIYLIFANVLFTHERPGVEAGFKLLLERENQTSPATIGHCLTTIPKGADRNRHGASPCHAMLPYPLMEGDKVYLNISDYRMFRVAKESLFFGLIKLNGDAAI